MASDQHDDNEKAPQDKVGLSKETVEQVKSAILHGVGYKRPPQHTRFKKGQSGNPKGRPRTSDLGLGSSRSANALALREGERLVNIREGEHVRQIPAIEAVYRSQLKSATSGSAYAQKHFIQRYDWAEREQRKKIADDLEFWSQCVDLRRAQIAEAKANGQPLPEPLPHPDDIIIDYEKGVQIVGPFSKEGRAFIEESARFRDVLIMQDALDQRMADSADPLEQPGSALVFAHVFNASLPERYQLSEMTLVFRMDHYARWPKRKLLKEVYRAWRSLGLRVPRGRTLPPLRYAKQTIDEIAEYLASGQIDDVARFTALPLHIQIDAMGIARRKHLEGNVRRTTVPRLTDR